MGKISHVRPLDSRPRSRLARYLAVRCGRASAVAREISDPLFECSLKRAENLLDGHWPDDLTMAAIVRRFGAGVWNAVFLPEAEPELAALIEREGKLREELARMEKRRLEMGADRSAVGLRLPRMEDAS